MARVYDIGVAALALSVERKWLDNLTSQHAIPGTEHFARGVARRLSMRTLLTAAIVRDLNHDLGVPVSRGVELAVEMLGAQSGESGNLEDVGRRVAVAPDPTLGGESRIGSSLTLSVDVAGLEREIERRLLDAMEAFVPRRRGRPPRKERRGTR
jgi:hypothetical protein